MIKVMIVDDEILVRVGLKMIIPWEDYGFKIISEAGNGIEALQLCEIEKPDLILTDIIMPGMNGMELIKRVKNLYKDIYFVILTCLDERHYIREAMELGATGYLTKISLDKNNILKLINVLKDEINVYGRKDNNKNQQRKFITNNQLSPKEKMPEDVIRSDVDELCNLPGMYQLNDENSMISVDINIDRDIKDDNLLKTSIFNLLENLMCKDNNSWKVFTCANDVIFIIGKVDEADADAYRHKIKKIMHMIQENLKLYLNLTCSVSYFTGFNSLDEAYGMYMESRKQRSGTKNRNLSDTYNSKDSQDILFYEYEQALVTSIKEGNIDQVKEIYDIMAKIAQQKMGSLEIMKKISLRFLFLFEQEFRKCEESIDICFETDIINEIAWCSSLLQMRELMFSYIDKMIGMLLKIRDNYYRKDIKKIINFVNIHYNEKITLDYAASLLYMNSSYFSRLFKKETGSGFVEYLTKIRIEQAKSLLKSSDLKIVCVAEKVGYDDVRYFSKIFRKATGLSPSEYREQNK